MKKTLTQEVRELSAVVRKASDREMWTQMFCAVANGYMSNGSWGNSKSERMNSGEIVEAAASHADRGMKELNKRYPQ
jgi:hypothetical protein